jgi:hypothetical protein
VLGNWCIPLENSFSVALCLGGVLLLVGIKPNRIEAVEAAVLCPSIDVYRCSSLPMIHPPVSHRENRLFASLVCMHHTENLLYPIPCKNATSSWHHHSARPCGMLLRIQLNVIFGACAMSSGALPLNHSFKMKLIFGWTAGCILNHVPSDKQDKQS